MNSLDLKVRENELKKRLRYDYIWGRKQNNRLDKLTNFIYDVFYFDELIKSISKHSAANDSDFFNYALNRWYNFWSANAVEKIFCSFDKIKPALNHRDRLVDFEIEGIKFDHKTSIFPENYPFSLEHAQSNKKSLIEWLYKNQSQQQRKHLKNRLFIVLYDMRLKQHWKLKSELIWLSKIISEYTTKFDAGNLIRLELVKGEATLSDIIWGIRS
ncbi:MAG: hypothetical protein K8F36_04255 [Melioribacteraceae bacterium]|nr:hypothetical protein [Melioribacteraceae bacterium]